MKLWTLWTTKVTKIGWMLPILCAVKILLIYWRQSWHLVRRFRPNCYYQKLNNYQSCQPCPTKWNVRYFKHVIVMVDSRSSLKINGSGLEWFYQEAIPKGEITLSKLTPSPSPSPSRCIVNRLRLSWIKDVTIFTEPRRTYMLYGWPPRCPQVWNKKDKHVSVLRLSWFSLSLLIRNSAGPQSWTYADKKFEPILPSCRIMRVLVQLVRRH